MMMTELNSCSIYFLMNVYDYVDIYYICSIIIDPINDMFMLNLLNSNIQ